jgi:hypothetical protein
MTPKEKANELVVKFIKHSRAEKDIKPIQSAKQCALIAVDEAIDQWEYIDIYISNLGEELNTNLKYWYNVKQEIEKL